MKICNWLVFESRKAQAASNSHPYGQPCDLYASETAVRINQRGNWWRWEERGLVASGHGYYADLGSGEGKFRFVDRF